MALRLALDTNRYVDLCRDEDDVAAKIAQADALFVPFVVLGELRAGFAISTRARQNERVLQRFLARPGVDILFATEATTVLHASLFRQLRDQGTPIPSNDLWIAALVLEHRLVLYPRDSHFDRLPQLDRLS